MFAAMKTILVVAMLLWLSGTLQHSRAQSGRPLTDWEIRTGTSQEAQAARGRRQNEEVQAKKEDERKRKQANADARDPDAAEIRRAAEDYRTAATAEDKRDALARWQFLVARYERMEQEREWRRQAQIVEMNRRIEADDQAIALRRLADEVARLRVQQQQR